MTSSTPVEARAQSGNSRAGFVAPQCRELVGAEPGVPLLAGDEGYLQPQRVSLRHAARPVRSVRWLAMRRRCFFISSLIRESWAPPEGVRLSRTGRGETAHHQAAG